MFCCLFSCVIDTAYLYTIQNEPGQSPSVRDIADQLLGIQMGNIHDSVQDAGAAMKAALYLMQYGLPQEIGRSEGDKTCLMVHRIPDGFTEQHIVQLFTTSTFVVPSRVQPIAKNANSTAPNNLKTMAYFETAAHAELAFETLAGPDRPDKSNKSQKRVYVTGGGYICVRKS